MSFNIAVAGKGGTGKTTLCSLIIRQLIKAGKKPVLAVDADANANLNEALGMEIEGSIADVLVRINNNLDPLPAGMTKDQYVEYKVHQSLSEGDNVDLLVMGGPEGAGCYCYANNLLRGFVAELSKNYPYMVMDNEAGMEHLSRRTTQNIDVLFITSDSSARGIRSAGRVKDLVENLKLDIKKMYLVVSRVNTSNFDALKTEIEKTGLELIGTIPMDEQVMEFDLLSKPLIDLPDDSPVVAVVNDILKKAAIL
ncbi:AAA family ATPase [Desulfallas thermosapovorans]|uniref:CO dehydrogenase maturation factor n=1 Tax=Desulfallas thermosapovorans DSM 6562 TaxID=1121431 RepID=A0A5S4ZXH5_9FIRM|nr:AAA family ATPase [Desulfallas thermosapovorans]TYO97722.1 CO dehydrogenase maturation factor [Desulfallas thermosapovorans DSM 6562]